MKVLGIIAIVWLSLCVLVVFVLHIKSHKFIKSVFLNATLGLAAIVAINITQKYTGVFVPLNWYTVGGSTVFGLPAVCGVILLQVLI